MIEIKATKPNIRTIRTSDIPVGQVFRGRVYGNRSKRWTAGLFYKAQGSWVDYPGEQKRRDLLLVRLDAHGEDGFANVWDTCSEVQNYEPLKAVIDLQPM